MHYDDGSIYDGEFLNGMRHGKGKVIYPDGTSYEGRFEEDNNYTAPS